MHRECSANVNPEIKQETPGLMKKDQPTFAALTTFLHYQKCLKRFIAEYGQGFQYD
jgi:hypothetical protein